MKLYTDISLVHYLSGNCFYRLILLYKLCKYKRNFFRMFTSVILLKASTEQIPTYKQYKYLRPDPTEAEMAQATVNKEMDIKKLSEVASVTVTKQGDSKFMVIPKEEVLLETEVVFTRRNWISFVTVGRPKILQAIHDKKDVKFLYHGNSKVAIVVHRDSGSYQVHLMTYSAKGSPRRDLCVYLTQEEDEALEIHIPDINHAIELITLSTSSNKKTITIMQLQVENYSQN